MSAFWIVKALIRSTGVHLFVRFAPVPLYLRALGAEVGPAVRVSRGTFPVCFLLLPIGAGTVIPRESSSLAYRAQPAGSRSDR